MSATVQSYRDLTYWQFSKKLALQIYKLTENFPKSELYGMTSQMRRAVVSIPANIAEGYRRGSRKEYRVFLTYSFGSGAELETFLDLCLDLTYITQAQYAESVALLDQIMRMLNAAINKLTNPYSPLSTP